MVDKMALAMQAHEGFFAPSSEYPQGSVSYRNNNPGNIKYAEQPYTTGQDAKGFAMFDTYAHGFEALKLLLIKAAIGYSAVYNPDMTLLDFFAVYAPSDDGNSPNIYALDVANGMGVSTSFLISGLLT